MKSSSRVLLPLAPTPPRVWVLNSVSGENDEVIGMVCVEKEELDVLVVSENGYGKRSSIQDYRITNRGGKGVKTINVTEKTGSLIALLGIIVGIFLDSGFIGFKCGC